MFVKNQHSLTLSPQPGINFLLTPCWALRARGERARAADTGALFGRGLRLLTEYRLTWRNAPAPLPASKSSKTQQAPGFIIGSPGRARRGVRLWRACGHGVLGGTSPKGAGGQAGLGGSSGTHTPPLPAQG